MYVQVGKEVDYKKLALAFDAWLEEQKIHVNLEDIKNKWEELKEKACE